MNIQQLRYAVATADHGSMTAAAAALYVAQPALSRGIRQLERELDTTLFARAGRAAVPTAEGEVFVLRTRAVLRSIDALRDLRRVQDETDPPLVIAASPTLQSATAVPLLAALRDQGAAVPTRLVGCTSSDQVADLVATGGADVGVSTARSRPRCRSCSWAAPRSGSTPPRASTCPRGSPSPTSPPYRSCPRPPAVNGGRRSTSSSPPTGSSRWSPRERRASVWLAAVASGIASCIWHSVEALVGPAGARRRAQLDPPFRQEADRRARRRPVEHGQGAPGGAAGSVRGARPAL